MRRAIALLLGLSLLCAPAAAATLRYGDKGGEVTRLTERLQELMYLHDQTETYDRSVAAAVKAFRADAGLRAESVADDAAQEVLYSEEAWALRLTGLPAPDLSGAAKAMASAAKTIRNAQNEDGSLLLEVDYYQSAFELTLVKDWGVTLRVTMTLQEDRPLYSGDTLKALLRVNLPEAPADGLMRLSGTGGQWETDCPERELRLDLTQEETLRQALLDGSLALSWQGKDGTERAALADWEPLTRAIPAQLTRVWDSLKADEVSFCTECAALCRAHLSE